MQLLFWEMIDNSEEIIRKHDKSTSSWQALLLHFIALYRTLPKFACIGR